MSSRRTASPRPRASKFLRPWLIAAGIGLVLGALLLSLDSGESPLPFVDYGAGENAGESFHPTEAMIQRAATEFRDPFSRPATTVLADGQNAGLTPPLASPTAEKPGSAR